MNFKIDSKSIQNDDVQIQSRSMSDPPLSDIDYEFKTACVWTTLKYTKTDLIKNDVYLFIVNTQVQLLQLVFPNDNIFLNINNKMSYSNILGTRTSIYLRRLPKIIKITLITMILTITDVTQLFDHWEMIRFRNSFESLPVSFLSHVYVGIPLVFK